MEAVGKPTTQGDPVGPVDPSLPTLQVEWQVDGKAQTSVAKNADGIASIRISATLLLDGKAVPIAELQCTNLKDSKWFDDKIPATTGAVGGTSTPAAPTGASSTSGAGSQSAAGSPAKDLRCKFHFENEEDFFSQRNNCRTEILKFKLIPTQKGLAKLADIIGVKLDKEFPVELAPCKVELSKPSPEFLGSPQNQWNSTTKVTATVVRRDRTAINKPSDDCKAACKQLWLDFTFLAPSDRKWITETKLTQYSNGQIVPWKGGRKEGGRWVDRDFFESSNDWIAHKCGLTWPKTADAQLAGGFLDQKKPKGHVVQTTDVNDNGNLVFGSDPHFSYDHLSHFSCDFGQCESDEFSDLRGDGASVRFRIIGQFSGSSWRREASEATVTLMVPNPETVASSGDEWNWFEKNCVYENWCVAKAKAGKQYEYLPGAERNVERIKYGASLTFYCHDYAFRMPEDRTRVDMPGFGFDPSTLVVVPHLYGYERIEEKDLKKGDIVAVGTIRGKAIDHSMVVVEEEGYIDPPKLKGKGEKDGIFTSWLKHTEDSFIETQFFNTDPIILRYGTAEYKLHFLRRVKCAGGHPIKNTDSFCPTCGRKRPGEDSRPMRQIP